MKRTVSRLDACGILGLCILLASCAPSREWPAGDGWGAPPSDSAGLPSNMRLDDYLATQRGVWVDGSGRSARIHMNGADYPAQPLFVIDHVVIGYDFSRVWALAPMRDVASVRAIRPTEADAARYGARGGNGVIEITMKRGS